MKYLLTIMKIPFIVFFLIFILYCYTELGCVQIQTNYVMDINYILTYSFIMGFLLYGFYASLRDVILLLYRESIKIYVRNITKNNTKTEK